MRRDPVRPGGAADPRHRRFPEALVIDNLAFRGWTCELAAGQEAAARRGAAAALERAVSAGAQFARAPTGERLFDPVEVQAHLSWLAESGVDRTFIDQLTATNTATCEAARGDGAPERPFEISFSRTFDLSRFALGARVRLRAPLPLRCGYHEEVSVTPETPETGAAEAAVSEGRLEANLIADGAREARIGAKVRLTALTPVIDPYAGRLGARQAEIHLRPSEGLIQVSPRVADIAARVAGDAAPLEAVARFDAFLCETFRFQYLRYDELPAGAAPDWVLESGVYDCQMCSATLISLCRARGIPARLVAGNFLYEICPTNHNWVEIWIDDMGWTPFDVMHLDRDNAAASHPEGWWRDLARRADFRLASQRLPLEFTGPMSVRFPPLWQVLHTGIPGGVAITFFDVATGEVIYRDEVVVKRV